MPSISPPRRLVGLLRPGGRFVVTTWERGAIVPVPEIMAKAVVDTGAGTPPPEVTTIPGGQISTPDGFASWLSALGLRDIEVTLEPREFALDAERAWNMIMGGGMRALLLSLDAGTVARVRARFLELLDERGVHSFNATSLVGVGTTPG